MKTFKSFRLLFERVSDILYHGTTIYATKQILYSNEFNLTDISNRGSREKKINRGKKYFISFARSLQSSFFQGYNHINVLIKIDGRKFRNNKGFSVDFFVSSGSLKKDEMEDRLVSDKKSIKIPYGTILEIHIDTSHDDSNSRITKEVIKHCEIYKIPVFVHDNRKDFMMLKSNNKK